MSKINFNLMKPGDSVVLGSGEWETGPKQGYAAAQEYSLSTVNDPAGARHFEVSSNWVVNDVGLQSQQFTLTRTR